MPGHVAVPAIVTGFRAFPGVPANPTAVLVDHLAACPSLLPANTRLALLDVAYHSAPAAIDALLEQPPAALVLTGYSHLATGVTLEACATALCAADKPDALGHLPAPLAGEVLATGANLSHLAALLEQAGIPASISHDAGQYLCNFAYRHALARVAERGWATQVLFVHLPALAGTPLAGQSAACLPLTDMARAVATIVAALADKDYSPPV
jgi:pyroglutamyl-peptidase